MRVVPALDEVEDRQLCFALSLEIVLREQIVFERCIEVTSSRRVTASVGERRKSKAEARYCSEFIRLGEHGTITEMKLRRFLLASAIALAATTLSTSAETAVDRTFALKGATALEIDVQGGDASAIADPLLKVVQVHVSGRERNAQTITLAANRQGATLKLSIHGAGAALLPFTGSGTTTMEVRFPPALRLRVRQYGGSVTLENSSAPAEIYNASGGITITSPHALVTAQADNGDIALSGARASIELTAGTGNVDAQLDPHWAGHLVRMEATSGNLRLTVPPGFRGKFDTTTGGGIVSNALASVPRAPLVFMLAERGNVTVSVQKP